MAALTDSTTCRDNTLATSTTADIDSSCITGMFITEDSRTCRPPVIPDIEDCGSPNTFIVDDTTCRPLETTDIHEDCTANTIITDTVGTCTSDVPCMLDLGGIYHCGTSASEWVVNTVTEDYQQLSSITALIKGGYVISWAGNQVGSYNVYAQRYNKDHNTDGNELLISSVNNINTAPEGAGLIAGGYIIVWQSYSQAISLWKIYAQRHDKDYNVIGNEFQVSNIMPSSEQTKPAIAGLINGGYVITWESYTAVYDIYAQAYDKDHNIVASEFEVADGASYPQRNPSIAGLIDGSYVIVWKEDLPNDMFNLYAQPYDKEHNAIGSKFLVVAIDSTIEYSLEIAGLITGGYVIIWQNSPVVGDSYIYAQIYNKDHTIAVSAFQVSSETSFNINPSVAGLINGGYVITWKSSLTAIHAKIYDKDHNVVGSEFEVATTTIEVEYPPVIAGLIGGDFVISWQSGSVEDIYAKSYDIDIIDLII